MPTARFLFARTVRDGDFVALQPGNEDTEQLKVLCRQRRFVSHELSNAKRRLTGLIDRNFPSSAVILRITTAKRPMLCSKGSERGRYRPASAASA
jgi:hypothetical protein